MSLLLTESSLVQRGLEDMLTHYIGDHGYFLSHVDLPIALYVVEIAKRAEDRHEWFPRGKWATIQSIQALCDIELAAIISGGKIGELAK